MAVGLGYVLAQQAKDDKPRNQSGSTADTSGSKNSDSVLDLSGKQLTLLPESVLEQSNLVSLNVSNNQLSSLPAGIKNLENLETLNVENNRLTSFPAEISRLKKLREIRANNNRIISLPAELQNMKQLKMLDISGNSVPSDQLDELKIALPDTEIKT